VDSEALKLPQFCSALSAWPSCAHHAVSSTDMFSAIRAKSARRSGFNTRSSAWRARLRKPFQ